ncbi:PA2817 family protein [Halioglobus maricola]|uniref:PA2817 family protein n=1 Tax=Halioglobus maricola TaxID=2601894 RepID=UPI00197ADEC7|nr:PA2817 family protein [Halioglobus maricola]
MNDTQYAKYCRDQLSEFASTLQKRTEDLTDGDSLKELAASFSALANGERDLYGDGPTLISRLFTTYPDFGPTLPRDLLWFLGGECLHYMPDDEIATYQQLDELRHEAASQGKVLDLHQARSSIGKVQ